MAVAVEALNMTLSHIAAQVDSKDTAEKPAQVCLTRLAACTTANLNH